MNIEVPIHSSIKITNTKIIYIDPFKITEHTNDADIIFITHDHYDHYSEEDILKIKNNNTLIVIPNNMFNKVNNIFESDKIIKVLPNNEYSVLNIKFNTIPSYNINKKFHPKENNWVGYIIDINDTKYYIAGDTDITEENKKVKCDIAFIPIGGTYTMDYKEASELTNIIKPSIVIPIHYGDIVGTEEDANLFKELLDPNIKCEILIKK